MLQRDIKTWQQEFQKLIQEVKPYHTWTLKLDKSLIPNNLQPGWVQYQQWVFARFQCSLCSRSWASAQVHVLFHMHWSKRESAGWVRMRIFAQRCQKCIQPPFEMPKFTEENISRILKNLVIQILKRCYKEGFKSMQEVPTLKENYTEGRHDVDNCEACLQGFCAQSGLGLTTQLPKSLALPIIRSPSFEIPIHEPSSKKRSITEGTVPTGASHPVETRIQVPRSSENPYSHRAWNPKKMIAGFCGCLLILILIIVVVVVVVVKPNA